MIDETRCNATVLVEKNDPLITFSLGPMNALIQGLGNAQVFSILDELKSKQLSSCAHGIEILRIRAIVDNNKPLHLGENIRNLFDHTGVRMMGDNYRAYTVWDHLQRCILSELSRDDYFVDCSSSLIRAMLKLAPSA